MRIKPCRPPLLPVKNIKWSRLVSLIGDAREAVARLDEELIQEKEAPSILEPIRWQEAMASLRSQNITADYEEILWYRFAHLAPEERAALLQKIVAAKDALDAGIRWGRRRKVSQQFFCRIHAIVKKNGPSPDAGRIRNRQNWIGLEGCKIEDAYFYPPKANRVRPLLRNLDGYLVKDDCDPIVQIAIGFAQFLIIHPFMDGNGRVARVFIPVMAAKKKLLAHPALFLSAYFESHRLDYFQKLFWISEKGAWEDWIAYFLKGVISQAKKTRRQLIFCQKLWNEAADLAGVEAAKSLFYQPLITKEDSGNFQSLIKEKLLIAQGEEHYLFEPLVRAMRNT